MTARYNVLGTAKIELVKTVAKAQQAVDRARTTHQRVGTMQEGASKKAYQKAKIRWWAACEHLTMMQEWLDTCEEMIKEETT